MKNFRNLTGIVVLSLLLGCQFPQTQPNTSGSPSSSSSPSSSGSPPPSGQSPPSSSDGESGSEGDPGSPPSSSGESESSEGSTMGEQMPLPAGAGGETGEAGLEDLDSQLDEALGDFDEAMGESSAASSNGGGEQEIDILNPMTSGEGSSENGEPLYDDGDLEGSGGENSGSVAVENESIAQRAAQGTESGSQSGGQQGSASASEGGESGASSIEGQQAGSNSSETIADGAGNVIPVPEDVGDGRNDDIVLRQIREAAVREKDPVLREKLWQEYRRIRDQK